MAGISQIYADGFARDLIPRSTAPTFLSSTSYAVGDYVYYQGNLYRCTTAHTGTWVASHFTAVTVGSELKAKEAEIADVKTDLSDLEANVNVNIAWSQGYIRSDGSFGSDSARCYSSSFSGHGRDVVLFINTGFVLEKIAEYNGTTLVHIYGIYSITGSYVFKTTPGYNYRLQVRNATSSALAPSDISASDITVNYAYTDTTLSLEGKIADAKATGDALNVLTNNLSQVQNAFVNVYNPKNHTYIIGGGYNANTGEMSGTDTKSVTFPEYVKLSDVETNVIRNNNETRYINNKLTVSRVFYYAVDKSYIDAEILLPLTNANIPSNAVYVRFAYTILETTMTEELVDTFGTTMASTITNIDAYVNKCISDNIPIIFYVGANRSGADSFTTLKACTEYIWNNGIYDAIVYVDKGTYNLETEFGSEWLESWVKPAYNPTASGLKVGNRTHYIFEHDSKILFNYSGSNTDIATAFSPINIAGSCKFDNMQIEARNCRYCVHEDYYTINTNYEPYQVEYNNCEMLYHAKTLEGGVDGEPIGAGCMPGSVSIINGGCFINEVNQADISYHNYSTSSFGSGTSMVVIKNAYMAHWCGFGSYGDSVVYGYVSGCRMKMAAQNGYVNNVIRQWGNTIEST